MNDKPKTITIKKSAPKKESSYSLAPWVVLVIDDEQSLLDVTEHVLKNFRYSGRTLELVFARSLKEAKACYEKHPNAALALVDVMMETNTAGLDFIHFVRKEKRNIVMQLVLRTGQPGFAPEREVLLNYDINDYLSKPELTSAKLNHSLIAYLRNYENMSTIDKQRESLALANEALEKQNRQLSQLDRIKDDLLSVVSHELRSPVSGIEGLADLLLMDSDSMNDGQTERVQLIKCASHRIKYLVNDLIDEAMIRRNDFRMNIQAEDISQIVEDIMPSLYMQAQYVSKEGRVVLENCVPEGLPQVLADSKRIQQVVVNLVVNALKFTQAGEVVLSAEVDQQNISVHVKDTGYGIEEHDLEEIFTAFTQVKTTSDQPYEGIGLGLSITKKIVDAHNGRIYVDSKPGQGSCFTFTLPLAGVK